MVLHGIDEKYPWHSLAWVEMRRRSRMKFEYVDALCAPLPIDEELVSVLQVSMPLSECITGRYAAAKYWAHVKASKSKKEQEARPKSMSRRTIKVLQTSMSK